MLYSANSGFWKIADFGLTSEGLTQSLQTTHRGRGTGGYRAPELMNDSPTFGKKSDIWSLGCILYELCFGDKAFKHDHDVLNYALVKQPLTLKFLPSLEEASSVLLSWLQEMLHWNFQDRPTASGSGRHFAKLLSLTTKIPLKVQADWEESDLLNTKNLLGTDLPIKRAADSSMNHANPRWEEVVFCGGSRSYNIDNLKRAKKLVDARDRLLGKEHPHSIWSRTRLAWTSYYVGPKRVIDIDPSAEFTELLKLKGETDDRETAALWAGLGWTAFGLRNYDSALRNFEKALEIHHRLGHTRESDTLSFHVGLAGVQLGVADLSIDGEDKNAENGKRKRANIEDALASAKDVALQAINRLHVTLLFQRANLDLGHDHQETAETMSLLAWGYQIVSKIEKASGLRYHPKTALPYEQSAEALYKEAFTVQEAKLGIYHPQTLHSLYEIAQLSLDNGQFTVAVEKLEVALEKQRMVLGVNDDDTKATVKSLLRAYREQGDTNKYKKLSNESNPKPRLPLEKPKRRQIKAKAQSGGAKFKAVEHFSSQASV